MPGIRHGERFASLRHAISGKGRHAFDCGKRGWIEIKLPRKVFVQPNKTRGGHAHRQKLGVETLRQARIAVIAREKISMFGLDLGTLPKISPLIR
jgi:hypothetical protein